MNQSRPEAKLSTSDPFAVQPQSSLCDLHGLRAVLSLRRIFLGMATRLKRYAGIPLRQPYGYNQ
jgi:hypothetical protein